MAVPNIAKNYAGWWFSHAQSLLDRLPRTVEGMFRHYPVPLDDQWWLRQSKIGQGLTALEKAERELARIVQGGRFSPRHSPTGIAYREWRRLQRLVTGAGSKWDALFGEIGATVEPLSGGTLGQAVDNSRHAAFFEGLAERLEYLQRNLNRIAGHAIVAGNRGRGGLSYFFNRAVRSRAGLVSIFAIGIVGGAVALLSHSPSDSDLPLV